MAQPSHAPVRRNRPGSRRQNDGERNRSRSVRSGAQAAGTTVESVMRLTQAYSQAPWRKQIQMIVFFLLVLVMIALVAGIYLSVSGRAVATGVEIQTIEEEIEVQRKVLQDLETQLAWLSSSSIMEERADSLGLEPIGPERIEYIEVPGYPGRQGPSMAPPPKPSVVTGPALSPEFTESIIDWFMQNVIRPSGLLEVGQ